MLSEENVSIYASYWVQESTKTVRIVRFAMPGYMLAEMNRRGWQAITREEFHELLSKGYHHG